MPRDAKLAQRMQHTLALDAWEEQVYAATREAMERYLAGVAAALLDGKTSPEALEAVASGQLIDEAGKPFVAAGPPNTSLWPGRRFWERLVERLILPILGKEFAARFSATLKKLTGKSGATGAATRITEHRAAFLAEVDNRLRQWPETAFKQVRDELQQAQQAGEGVDQMRDRVSKILRIDAFDADTRAKLRAAPTEADRQRIIRETPPERREWDYDARRIARTESIAAYNGGAATAAVEVSPAEELLKTWLATNDNRTRPTHRDADGQTVPMDEPFTVGVAHLQYPGDPTGPGEETINCRCVLTFDSAQGDENLLAASAAPRTSLTAAAAIQRVADASTPRKEAAMPVIGSTILPLASQGRPWDAAAAKARVKTYATNADGELNYAKYGRAFFYRAAPGEGGPKEGDFKLPFADVIDGKLVAVPRAVFAVASVLGGGRGGVDIPETDVKAVKSRVATYYRRMEMKAPWLTACADPRSRALIAAAAVIEKAYNGAVDVFGEQLPPGEWFGDPQLLGPLSLPWPEELGEPDPTMPRVVVTPEGRVFGYTALWDNCHISFPGECVTPPPTNAGYDKFHRLPVMTASGPQRLGMITMNTGHAGTGISLDEAAAHYDDTGTQAAVVRAGEDAYGIWVAGAVVPWLSETDRRKLALSGRLSGDWREIGGRLEMVASHTVNVPGFLASASTPDGAGGAPGETPTPTPPSAGGTTTPTSETAPPSNSRETTVTNPPAPPPAEQPCAPCEQAKAAQAAPADQPLPELAEPPVGSSGELVGQFDGEIYHDLIAQVVERIDERNQERAEAERERESNRERGLAAAARITKAAEVLARERLERHTA